MADNEPYGPDGFPLCKKCAQQRRSENMAFPGLCQECISKIPDDERAAAIRTANGGEELTVPEPPEEAPAANAPPQAAAETGAPAPPQEAAAGNASQPEA